MDITLEAKLQNEHWEEMNLEIVKNSIEIEVPGLGRVQMSHADFDIVARKVTEFRRACDEVLNIEIS